MNKNILIPTRVGKHVVYVNVAWAMLDKVESQIQNTNDWQILRKWTMKLLTILTQTSFKYAITKTQNEKYRKPAWLTRVLNRECQNRAMSAKKQSFEELKPCIRKAPE